MFKDLYDELMKKKQQLQSLNNESNENKIPEKENSIDINVSNNGNLFKIEISDFVSINDYIKKKNSSDKYSILSKISNSVLWNGSKQKVNKGIYYVIISDNRLYNILINDYKIVIDERTKKEIDEQTGNKNITEERVITIKINNNEYHYFSAKHEENGNTYYTKYYNKNINYSLGALDLSKEETYQEISSIIFNIENIEGVENIINIKLLKESILDDLVTNKLQIKKTL